jgi:hypothetical protein
MRYIAPGPARRSRQLVDQGDQRQLVGVGEKEAAEAGRGGPQVGVGLGLIQPGRDGAPREIGRNRRVPAPFGEVVRPADPAQLAGEPLPAAFRIPRDDLRRPA